MSRKNLMRVRRSPLVLVAAAVACLTLSAAAMAATLTVGTNGEQYTTIQAAINASTNGDTILVSAGSYGPIDLRNKNVIVVSTNTASPSSFVISAGLSASEAVLMDSTNVAIIGSNPGTLIDGFTIKFGTQFGVNCGTTVTNGSNATIDHSVITSNGPTSGTSSSSGVFMFRGTIQNSTISNNVCRSTTVGGAGLCLGLGALVLDCTVTGNQSITAAGGGIFANDQSVTIVGGSVDHNVAPLGGGISNFAGEVRAVTVSDNQTNGTLGGAGIAFGTLGTTGKITECTINGNTASGPGGGIHSCTGGVISRNRIFDNLCTSTGGGISVCSGELQNNLIYINNAGTHGGGIYNCDGNIYCNTIYANNATSHGGGLRSCNGSIRDNIVWDNTAAAEPKFSSCSTPKYCCYNGATQGSPNFNRSGNPNFTDVANADPGVWDFTPTSTSCQNNGLDLASVVLDFYGNLRPIFTSGATDYDIGAIEF